MDQKEKIRQIQEIAEGFHDCQKILVAIGDENRLHLIMEMMQMGECSGVRVGAVTERTHLSRPAVSHHLQILKEAGILKVRKEGTKNYYYFDPEMTALRQVTQVLQEAIAVAGVDG